MANFDKAELLELMREDREAGMLPRRGFEALAWIEELAGALRACSRDLDALVRELGGSQAESSARARTALGPLASAEEGADDA